MVRVRLGGTLTTVAGGRTEFEVEATNVREMMDRLGERFPQLKPVLERGLAIAIDGQIYRNAWLQPVNENSEIYLLPPMAGG
jgi:sulfur-carrier protein